MFLKYFPRASLLGLAFLFFVCLIPTNPDLLSTQARAGMLFAVVLLALRIGVELESSLAGIALAYFFSHSVLTFTALSYVPGWAKLAALGSFAWLLSIVASVTFLARGDRAKLFDALGLLCLLQSAIMVGKKICGLQPFFLLNNSSADACLIAALYPILAFRHWLPENMPRRARRGLSWLFILLPVAAVAVSGSSTGFVAIGLAILLHAALYRKQVTRVWLGISVLAVAAAGLGLYLFSPDSLFANSGRYKIWQDHYSFFSRTMDPEALERYRKNVDPRSTLYLDVIGSEWTGLGSGSFRPLSDGIQTANDKERYIIFPFAHNEPLQVILDQGYVGLVLALLAVAVAFLRALDRPYLFNALCIYAATMPVQFPLRYYASAFAGAVLFREAFATEGKTWQASKFYLFSARLLKRLQAGARLLLP